MHRIAHAIIAAFALIAFAAAPASAQVARCAYGIPSMCSPSLPGLENQLDPSLDAVTITSFAMRFQGGRWWVDLELAASPHPGEVRIASWGGYAGSTIAWVSGATKSVSLPVGPSTATSAHGISVEWDEAGATWHRWIGLHYGGPGSYHFTAGEGALIPEWVK